MHVKGWIPCPCWVWRALEGGDVTLRILFSCSWLLSLPRGLTPCVPKPTNKQLLACFLPSIWCTSKSPQRAFRSGFVQARAISICDSRWKILVYHLCSHWMFPDISGRFQAVFHGKGSSDITSTEGTTEACVQKWSYSKLNFSPIHCSPQVFKNIREKNRQEVSSGPRKIFNKALTSIS